MDRLYPNRLLFLNALLLGIISIAFGVACQASILGRLVCIFSAALAGALLGLIAEKISIHSRLRNWPSARRLLVVVLIEALLIIYVLIPGLGAYTNIHPGRSPISVTPAELGLKAEDVTLRTEDGITIKGWYIPSKN